MQEPLKYLFGDWICENGVSSVCLKLFLCFMFSAIIGCERSNKRHAAGLRTFILISIASLFIAIVTSIFSSETFSWVISASVIIGVAILSNNTILFTSRNQIKGLTTSAALWTTSLLSMVIGYGYYTLGSIGFIVTILSLVFLQYFEIYLKNRSNHFEIHLELTNVSYLKDFTIVIRELGLKIDDIESNPAYLGSGLSVYKVSLSIIFEELKKYKSHKEIIASLKTLDYIHYIEEMN